MKQFIAFEKISLYADQAVDRLVANVSPQSRDRRHREELQIILRGGSQGIRVHRLSLGSKGCAIGLWRMWRRW